MDDFVGAAVIIGVIALVVWGLIGLANNGNQYNEWLTRCQNDGGTVQETHQGFLVSQYECFKNGKIIDHES